MIGISSRLSPLGQNSLPSALMMRTCESIQTNNENQNTLPVAMAGLVWSRVHPTIFQLQAGGKGINVDIGSEEGEVADVFKGNQFDLLPENFQQGLLTIMEKASAIQGIGAVSSTRPLCTLVDLHSTNAELNDIGALRQIRTGDAEIVWGCTSRYTLVSDMVFCTPALILRTEPYHRSKQDNDPCDEGPVIIALEGGETEVAIHCTHLDLDVEMHKNFRFRNLKQLPEQCRIAFAKVLGTRACNVVLAKETFAVDMDDLKPLFNSNHLTSRYPIRFQVLNSDVLKRADYGDEVEFQKMCSTPFLTGDHRAKKRDKRGYLDPAAVFQLADLFWVSEHLCLRGPPYIWNNQYMQVIHDSLISMQEIRARSTLKKSPMQEVDSNKKERPRLKALLSEFFALGWDDAWENATLSQVAEFRRRTTEDIQYILTGEMGLHSITGLVPRRPLGPVGTATSSLRGTLEGGHSKDMLIKPGMGVALQGPRRQQAFGHVIGVLPGLDADGGPDIVVRPVLGNDWIPIGILTLADHEVLQTNIVLRVKATSIMGTYSHLPAAMFHAGCEAPQIVDKRPRVQTHVGVSVSRDKTLVAHAEVLDLDGSEYQDIQILERILDGSQKFQLWRVSPVGPETCLSILVEGSRLFGSAGRQLLCYCAELEALVHQFARSKTNVSLKVSENTFKVPFPGRILMEVVATYVSTNEYCVSLDSGQMAITVSNIAALENLFGRSIERYDFKDCNRGSVKIYGPVAFKWAMYDNFQPDGRVGRTEGVAAVTVGGWDELNRMDQIIRSSMGNTKSRAELSRPPPKPA